MKYFKVTLEKPVYKGFNLAYPDSKTSFVALGIEGEVVEAETYLEKKNYRLSRTKKIISPSSYRIQPRCKVYGKCGGCHYQHIEYEKQLEIKKSIAQEIFHPYKIEKIIPSPRPFRYRNKALLPVKKGKIGFYAPLSHKIIPFCDCVLQTKRVNTLIKVLKKSIPKIPHLTGIIIRTNSIDKILLAFITTKDTSAIRKQIASFYSQARNLVDSLWMSLKEKTSNYLLDGKNIFLQGEKDFQETFLGKSIFIEPTSFLQINTLVTEKIYQQIKDWSEPFHFIIDGYSGCGSIAIASVSDYQKQKLILSENNPPSFKMLTKNLTYNKITNYQIFQEDFETASKKINVDPKNSIFIVDPPRKGLSDEATRQMLEISPEKIIYLSCNPTTCKRDLDKLIASYQLEKIIIYDMFPQTYHFESLCLLKKKF